MAYYTPPTTAERAAAFDRIAHIIDEYIPTGTAVTAQIAFNAIITIVDLTGVHKGDADQLDLPLAA